MVLISEIISQTLADREKRVLTEAEKLGFALPFERKTNLDSLDLDTREFIKLNKVLAFYEKLYSLAPPEPQLALDNQKRPLMIASRWRTVELQDCRDAESTLRRRVQELLTDPWSYEPERYGVEAFSKDEVGAILRASIVEQLREHDASRIPIQYATIWVGNAEPRSGNDPLAKGNKLVMVLLAGHNAYFGTSMREISYVKDLIVDGHIYELNLDRLPQPDTTVYRSRFFGATAMRWALTGDTEVLARQIPLEDIPEREFAVVATVDDNAFKNIKLAIRNDHPFIKELQAGDKLDITIQGITCSAQFGQSVGAVAKGELVLAIGSSYDDPDDSSVRLAEIYENMGHAASRFKRQNGSVSKVLSGMPVEILNHRTGKRLRDY